MQNNKKRKIIIFTDLRQRSFVLTKEISSFYINDDVTIIFYSKKKELFLDGNEEIDSLKNILIGADFVINLLAIRNKENRILTKELKNLNIPVLGNSADTRLLFSTKNNLKRFFRNSDIKSPVFSYVGIKNPEELFSTFSQPSRIFSKFNNYFSEKIDSVEKMKKVYEDMGQHRSEYLIEEYIDGDNIYSLVIRKGDEVYSYNLFEKKNDKFDFNLEISNTSKKIFKDFDIDKFALISYKSNKIRSLFVLNIFVEFTILLAEKGQIVEKILEKEGLTTEDFFKSLDMDLVDLRNKNSLLERL